jgi:hypothetical protein
MKVFLLVLIGVLNLVYAAEQKDFYGVWFYNGAKDEIAKKYYNVFYEINKDAITVFVLNYNSHTISKYKYRIVKWKKNDANEYSLYTLSENNSEHFFRVYMGNSLYDMYIDSGYTEGNKTKKNSVAELNKAIRNINFKIEDTIKKAPEAEVKTVAKATPAAKAKVKDSTVINSLSINAYKTISKVDARKPATQVKVSYGAFDFRDGKTYKAVTIGKQTWMAENLNYDAKDSKCYENSESNCQKYGRLYNLATAKMACPGGWHLPTEADWIQLTKSAGITDFSASFGGLGVLARGHYNFRSIDYRGNWWSATDAKGTYIWNINLNDAGVYKVSSDKTNLFSVRCVKD